MQLRRLTREDGFTMITTVLVLFVVGILGAAAIAAANGDIHLSRYDQDDKEAYAAAQAGIDDYLAHLNQDSDYWTRCAGEDSTRPLGTGNAVNETWFNGTPPAGRKWRNVPGTSSRYSIELLPAPGKASCDVNDPVGSMVDNDGNIRIRAVGNVTGTSNYKAVVATFRRTGFLDFLYFTDLENQDPTYLQLTLNNGPTQCTGGSGCNTSTGHPDLYEWAADKCERHWWGTQASGDGRAEMPTWTGKINGGGPYTLNTLSTCGEITFASDDAVNGPFHSNDDILLSGSPDFGRSGKNDRVEVANISSSDQGWRTSGTPNFHTASGKLTTQAPFLELPPSNTEIKSQADPNYLFTGPTTFALSGSSMTVTKSDGSTSSMALPSNGVIYVQNSACGYGYNPNDTSSVDPGCGVVKVSGSYSKDLTIASEDDIIVTNNLTRASGSNAVLGLVAKNFVRVWHPVDGSCNNASGSVSNIQIDAAILSLAHSFTVDNYNCGSPLGNLSVNGVIAQKHRGIVGVGGSSITHGYIKNYNYDDRFKYRSPPYFLNPVQAQWRVLRENDQSGAK